MKKILSIAFALTVSLLLFSSCKEMEVDHAFCTSSVCDFSSDEKSKVDAYVVETYPYFKVVHTYHGIWEDAFEQAFDEFSSVCDGIDNNAMVNQLPAGGSYVIYLMDSETGQVVAMSQIWKNESETSEVTQ